MGLPEGREAALNSGSPHLLESPGIFIGKFSGPGKSWKMTLVLNNAGNLLQGPGIC